MTKVLFVCLGNICRSPLAQGIFENKINKLKLQNKYYAESAGTSGWHIGEKPHAGSRKIAKENDVDIEKQKSQAVSMHDKDEFDYIIAMDSSNKESLLHEFGCDEDKTFLMRKFGNSQGNVPDPYGNGEDAFQEVFDILDDSIDGFIRFLESQ